MKKGRYHLFQMLEVRGIEITKFVAGVFCYIVYFCHQIGSDGNVYSHRKTWKAWYFTTAIVIFTAWTLLGIGSHLTGRPISAELRIVFAISAIVFICCYGVIFSKWNVAQRCHTRVSLMSKSQRSRMKISALIILILTIGLGLWVDQVA